MKFPAGSRINLLTVVAVTVVTEAVNC